MLEKGTVLVRKIDGERFRVLSDVRKGTLQINNPVEMGSHYVCRSMDGEQINVRDAELQAAFTIKSVL